jgi:hypothetical protein
MFKASKNEHQLDIFSSTSSLLIESSLDLYNNPLAWHNLFRKELLMRIDESVFSDLFSKKMGAPNASIRILVSMMALKEAFGWSDSQLFEQGRFNLLVRSALGVFNINESLPAESTYYLLRKRIHEYQKATNIDLMEKAFVSVTSSQAKQFEVNGRSIRMDSKLIGSNIAWSSRYEIIHLTMSLFYKSLSDIARFRLTSEDKDLLTSLSNEDGVKVTYRSTGEEIHSKLKLLGTTIYRLVSMFNSQDSEYYQTLSRVYQEQYQQVDINQIELREKEEIKADSVQSPHDTDCTYRNKDGQKVKGYSVNITETCDDGSLNLITNIQVAPANTPDNDYVCPATKQTTEVLGTTPSIIHADGAYNSQENIEFCKAENIELCLNGIQGLKGQYDLNLTPDGLAVTDTKTGQTQIAKVGKKGNWSIKTENGYRYFTKQQIETCATRKEIETMPYEKRNKRNNVEASIFQLCYHSRNNKTRYRNIIKTKSWALLRCLWINLVRIKNYIGQICQRTNKLCQNHVQNSFFTTKNDFMNIFEQLFKIFLNPHQLFGFIQNNWRSKFITF